MVTTRAGTIRQNDKKAQRLLERLAQIGIVRGSLSNVRFEFIASPRRHVTNYSRWTVRCNPHVLVFERKHGDGYEIIAMGCVHNVCHRCIACDVDPDADVKDPMNFFKVRARNMNILWARDPYVNSAKNKVGFLYSFFDFCGDSNLA
jgi:hypothetical protein